MVDIDRTIELIKNSKHVPEEDVKEICQKVQEILIEESNVQLIYPPIVVCGDIHGQLHDLLILFEKNGQVPNSKYLFLGDFVDRGFYSVETFLLLISLKLRYPDRIYLVRGNHESRSITMVYGFYDECLRKYGSVNVWRYCCEVFDYLSLGALIYGSNSSGGDGTGNGVFCIHGGLSPYIEYVDQIKHIDRKKEVPHEGAMCDLLWSDPDDVPAWAVSPRGAGYLFGENEVKKFLYSNKLNLIARAHQLVMEGYKELFNGGLVTVWSAPNYCYRCGNVAAVLRIDDYLNRDYGLFDAAIKDVDAIPSKNPAAEYFL
ncbi:phosphoprotein phosphatase PP4 catalytic subunit [Saccharomycopsis crataegensis]|uniref:Serine/threonine-protein phosphatase n=1 Tax=Saccharomycopsis crataegensis TaxID=43959 RepID=A0AAV5QNQ4_9ASCO|nr:phosphoprotein phosphatase PP4 catalytic subunit [Saccharomycopsis crataegensis]